jgi:hypothetical protein
MMCFDAEKNVYDKYAVVLGTPNNAGFIPFEKNVGVVRLGVIYLKNTGSVRSGFYAITPRDIYRRRVDARPVKRLSIEQATLLIGGSLEHLGQPDTTLAELNAAIEPRALEATSSEELSNADVLFQEQIRALQNSEDSEEGWP